VADEADAERRPRLCPALRHAMPERAQMPAFHEPHREGQPSIETPPRDTNRSLTVGYTMGIFR
jgi:hypothetical protein